MQRRMVVGMLCAAVCACGDNTGPQVADREITIRTERSDYRPNELIIAQTTNRSGRLLYDDHCGGRVEGYELFGEWNASYGMARGCRLYGPDDWRETSIAIPDGTVHVDTLHVNGRAYTGTWRVRLLLRDESGARLSDGQSISDTFRVSGTWSP